MEGTRLTADIDGCWKGNVLHLDISLYDNGNLVKMKSTSINEDDLGKLERGEDVEGYWIKRNRIYFPTATDDKRMVVSATDVGIDIDELIDLAMTCPADDEDDFITEVVEKVAKNPSEKVLSYPKNDEKWNRAVEQAENFNMRPPDSASKTTLHLPGPGEPLAQIGRVAGIIYTSDKEGLGDNQQYIHEMKEPYPILALAGTNKKPVYIIFGGRTYISEPGDNSGEAPGWMID